MCQSGSLGSRTLSLRVCQTMVSCRRYEYGHTDWRSQYCCAQVGRTSLDQHTRAKPETLEGAAIRPQCDLVITSALDKVPGSWLYVGLRKSFVIAEVDGLH